MNARTALLGLFVALTIVFASTTVYESGIRTSLTSTSTATSTSTTTSTTTQTTTVISTFGFAKPLTDAYLSHIGAIVSGNMSALAAQYETNATLHKAPQNGQSSFDGAASITGFYNGELSGGCPPCFGVAFPFKVANETYSITMSLDLSAANVTSNIVFYGTGGPNPSLGVFAESLRFDISYVLQGGRWLISTESVADGGGYYCQTASFTPDGVLHCPILSM